MATVSVPPNPSSGILEAFPVRAGRHARWRMPFSQGTILALCLCALFVILFQTLRLCMYVRNRDLADGTNSIVMAEAFVIGLRFDLAVAALATMPLLASAKLAWLIWGFRAERRTYMLIAIVLGVFFVLLGLGELEFYREFFARYNRVAVEYWRQPSTVCSMIWNGYPVVRYLLFGSALSAVHLMAVLQLARLCMSEAAVPRHSTSLASVAATATVFGILAVAFRGGVRGTPLQWSDAVHCDSAFANDLAQNGFWTLGRALRNLRDHDDGARVWLASLPEDEARRRTQQLLVLPGEELVEPNGDYPLLRSTTRRNRSLSINSVSDSPPNVVLILMESFSGRFVGALGSDNDRTPEFNRLASEGILFTRCFSNGSHTHQANFAAAACFPNLPGYEFLMDTDAASQKFDSLPRALKHRGYHTMFLYNGDLAWDNMRGFFEIQGIDRFIGRNDFDRSSYFDVTWGVSDRELFERANREFATAKTPFYATVLTMSNHAPFDLPKPLPFPEVTDCGEWNPRMNGVRFADWAIGHFFELAKKETYFRNTIFVLVGDHGFSVPPILTELKLSRFHVPLLFYAPELLGRESRRRHSVASHVDIGPTILGLLNDRKPHQHWGRDLFALREDDPGFAIFKSSSNDDPVAFMRGNTLLLKTKSGERLLYTCDLGFPPQVVPLSDSDVPLASEMERDMQAYIRTALEVLTKRRVAP